MGHQTTEFWDNHFMKLAYKQALKAMDAGDVPVGGLIVQTHDINGQKLSAPRIISKGRNIREKSKNPVGHAEVVLIQKAAKKLGRWRLIGCTLYVTLEPCIMCSGAIMLSRLDRVCFAALEPKFGVTSRGYHKILSGDFNHKVPVDQGPMELECKDLIREFFKSRRLGRRDRL